MHVGLVVYDGLDGRSGGYRYDRQLVSYLRERGDEVEVISLPRRGKLGTTRSAISRSVRHQIDRPVDILLQDALCADVLWRHNRTLTEPHSVIAIVHLLRSADGMGKHRRPWEWLERCYLKSIDGAVCPSVATRNAARALAGVSTTVAYPSGRHEGIAADPASVRTQALTGRLEIAFVGNIIPRKGVLTFIEALERLDGDWRATIVGSRQADPAYARSVRRSVERHGSSSRIDVLGAVSDERLREVFEEAHVLAVPAHRESFGMVYLEAMEYGTVPIATAVGGPPEFVVDGYNGRLVQPDDPAGLRNILYELQTDRELLAALGDGGLETAASHETWTESMDRVRQFLRSRIDEDVEEPPPVTMPREHFPGRGSTTPETQVTGADIRSDRS